MTLGLNPTFPARLAQSERPLIGIWACSGSPLVTEIVAGAGLDWVLIDMEHSPNGLESALSHLQVLAAYPVTPMLRVPVGSTVVLKQVLDLGTQNVMVPMISTADEARAVAAAVHYPPRGIRGVGSALARSARWDRVPHYLADADAHVSLTIQLETAEAVRNAAEIASVDGVDAVFVGPADLAASMGHLGNEGHPEVRAAVLEAFRGVKAAGKPVGVNAFDPGAARAYLDAGASFVLVGADVLLLARGSEALARTWIPGVPPEIRGSYG